MQFGVISKENYCQVLTFCLQSEQIKGVGS